MSILKALGWLRSLTAAKADDKPAKCVPIAGEDEKDFMARCMRDQSKTKGKPHDQSVAICLSIWKDQGPSAKDK